MTPHIPDSREVTASMNNQQVPCDFLEKTKDYIREMRKLRESQQLSEEILLLLEQEYITGCGDAVINLGYRIPKEFILVKMCNISLLSL